MSAAPREVPPLPAGRRLIVFARVPRLGQVKTRLAAGIGDEAALAAYRRMLARALATAASVGVDSLELCIAGEDGDGECAALARTHGAILSTQRGPDLGERMREALSRALAEGCLAVLIGCDAPCLTPGDLRAAFEALAGHDAVFAPTEDGGYALVGCRRDAPEAFASIAWGGPTVMAETRDRLRAAGLSWSELRTVWDVDEQVDLARWQALEAFESRRGLLSAGAVVALAGALAPRRGRTQPASARIARFSEMAPGGPPAVPWQERRVSGVTPNRAVISEREGERHLLIESEASASAWAHPLEPGAAAAGLAWRWRVDGFPIASRLGERGGDDFAARIYLMFDYPLERVPLSQRMALSLAGAFRGEQVPAATICYLLHAGDDPGRPIESPFTSRVRMIVARPAARSGVWYEERRDVRRDFAACFGQEYGPGTAPLAAVAVGADSDQGGGRFRTWFADLTLR